MSDSRAAALDDMVRWLRRNRPQALATCAHCDGIAKGNPLPCRSCGGVTDCMYDVGSLDVQHDHYELCQLCWRCGFERPNWPEVGAP
jgi:hypothetical protein